MHEPRPFGAVTPDQFRRIREIFESALDQPIADRHAWLEAVCGSDTALLRQVERMLVADDKRHHLLDRSADATHEAVSVVCPSCGATVDATVQSKPRRTRAAPAVAKVAAVAAATKVQLEPAVVEDDVELDPELEDVEEEVVESEEGEEESEEDGESAIEDVSELGDDELTDVIDTEIDEEETDR